MLVEKILKKIKKRLTKTVYKRSYSQSGEDMIVDFIFKTRNINNPTYLDIGAHHPYFLSNSAFFYKKECRGINIEPNPHLFKAFPKYRVEDINLNIGVGRANEFLKFHIMSANTMSTFSSAEAEKLEKEYGMKIMETIDVSVMTIDSILTKYNDGKFPDFLSLDVEGVDFDILKSIDYQVSYPKVICVETISYSETGEGEKDTKIRTFLEGKGYMVFADTYINTIFVRKDFWVIK